MHYILVHHRYINKKELGKLKFDRFSVILNNGYKYFVFLCLYPEMDRPLRIGLQRHNLLSSCFT